MKRYCIGGATALLLLAAATAGQAQQLPREPEAQYPERPRGKERYANLRNARPGTDPVPLYRSSLSLEMGWGAPYGFGVTYAQHLSPALDVNGGVGLGAGFKIGVGTRYYLRPDRAFTPYVGANLTRTSRVDDVSITVNGEEALFSMSSSGVLHLRGGLRWQPGRLGLLSTVGYGLRFTGDPITYNASALPPPSQYLRDVVQHAAPGGVEVSVGLVIGLGK